VLTLTPPAVNRRWNAIPLPGLTMSDACGLFAVRPARIITPALVQAFTFCTASTRAVASHDVESMVSVRPYTKWNASAVPQMSAPLAVTVKTPSL